MELVELMEKKEKTAAEGVADIGPWKCACHIPPYKNLGQLDKWVKTYLQLVQILQV